MMVTTQLCGVSNPFSLRLASEVLFGMVLYFCLVIFAGRSFEKRSLFTVVMLQRFTAKNPTFGRAHRPFLAIVIVNRLTDGIVRHHVENQVLRAVVDELMGFAGLEDKGVASLDWGCSVMMSHAALAGKDLVKLPLGAMGV